MWMRPAPKDNGDRFWTWVFKAELYVLFRIDKSRGSQVLIEVLGKEFDGTLAYAFKLDPEDEHGQSSIDEIIRALWDALCHVWDQSGALLTSGEGGVRYLDLPARAEIAEVREAWFCPVTRRLLPMTFRGISPYLPERSTDALATCRKVRLPQLPNPFWDGKRKDAEHWLETDEQVTELRRLGAWINLNDRIAGFSDHFRAVEHSAQIDSALLTRHEGEFKTGHINLLSCSTRMEMGVDIGGLSAVAGRRSDSRSEANLPWLGSGRDSAGAAIGAYSCRDGGSERQVAGRAGCFIG